MFTHEKDHNLSNTAPSAGSAYFAFSCSPAITVYQNRKDNLCLHE